MDKKGGCTPSFFNAPEGNLHTINYETYDITSRPETLRHQIPVAFDIASENGSVCGLRDFTMPSSSETSHKTEQGSIFHNPWRFSSGCIHTLAMYYERSFAVAYRRRIKYIFDLDRFCPVLLLVSGGGRPPLKQIP